MICTESEAKTKWCAQARVGSSVDPGFSINRNIDIIPSEAACIGPRCMLWRWVDGETKSVERSVSSHLEVYDEVAIPPEARRGTCGLISGNQA